MTIQEVISYVDDIKPNSFSNANKVTWLNEVEGQIQSEVMLLSPADIRKYVYSATYTAAGIYFPDSGTMVCPSNTKLKPYGTITITGLSTYSDNNITATINSVSSDGKTLYFDEDTFSATGTTGDAGEATLAYDGSGIELLVPAPHDKLYYTYVQAMVDFYNGEYDRYSNAITLWNSFYDEYRKWYSHHINPANGNAFSMGYYISAYGLAVKHGYAGTEEEWLATLKGDTGATGSSIVSILRTSGDGSPGTTDTYTVTMTDGATSTFTVYNGRDGNVLTVDSALSSLSANPVQNSVIKVSLDSKADLVNGLIPSAQLPSYVDDVIEASNFTALPTTGEAGKIYVTINDNKTWRWSGSSYVEISASIALGETSATAYRGDWGKSAYDHSQVTGNPHGTQATNINITDSGGYYPTDTVEAALQQIGAELDGLAAALEGLL